MQEKPSTRNYLEKAYELAKRHYLAGLVLLVFVLFLITRLASIKSVPVFIDESIYINWSQRALQGVWSLPLIDGKPPLHALAMMPFIKLFGDPLVAGRMLSITFGALATLGMVLVGREIRDLKLGALAGLLWVLCPYSLWFERLALAESMLIAFFVLAVFFAVRAAMKCNLYYLLGSGVCTGLALWTKGSAQLLFLIIPFAYLVRGPFQKGMAKRFQLVRWLISVAVSLIVGYGMYCLLRVSDYFPKIAERSQIWTKSIPELLKNPLELFPTNSLAIFRALWQLVTPFFLLICFAGIFYGMVRRWRPAYFLFAWFVLSGLVVSLIAKHVFTRYWFVTLPPLILGGAYAVSEIPSLVRKGLSSVGINRDKKWATAAFAVVMIVLIAFFAIPVGRNMFNFVATPEKITIGAVVGYVRSKNAGWGYDEVVEALAEKATQEPVEVAAYDFFSSMAVRMYFREGSNLSMVTFRPNCTLVPTGILHNAREYGRPAYFVGNGPYPIPEDWPIEIIGQYPKDGNESLYMTFGRFVPPHISAIRTEQGPEGTRAIIDGKDFGEERGDSYVKFFEIEATDYVSWTDEQIVVVLPSELSGFARVQVVTPEGKSNHPSFKVE